MRKILLTALLLASSSLAYGYNSQAVDALDIEINSDRGRDFPLYPLRTSRGDTFRAYLEAVPQENYSIHVTNRGPERVGLVIAVDGRNIISGKKSKLKPNERMYILGPYQSATYNGWRTSSNRVNRFYFTDVEDSYSAAFGDYSAMGVIAIAAYQEKQRYRAPQRWNKRSDNSSGRDKGAAPQASEKNGRFYDEPGTGYGNEHYSPSVQVQFEAEKKTFARYFIKYEWRETLCEKGVRNCYSKNRFWNDRGDTRGYAPPPPVRKWFSRWRW